MGVKDEMKGFSDDAYIRLMRTLEADWKKDNTTCIEELLRGIKIIKNTPKRTTVVLWGDGTVTSIRAKKGTKMNDYAAFTAAFTERIIGSNAAINRLVGKTTEQI